MLPRLALYSAVTIATHWRIGCLAIGVAWAIAWAMKKGSGGRGGRQYQIVAALLTYATVSLSAVPYALFYWPAERHAELAASDRPTAAPEPQTMPEPSGFPST